MNPLAQFARLVFLCVGCSALSTARAATAVVPDKRDGQVLDALLLHLLADPKFDMALVSTNEATIVLHTRTPEKTGFLQSHQMRTDIGDHTLPGEAERDLRRRNSPPDAKPDTFDSAEASFTNLTFSAGIVVADLSHVLGQRRGHGPFAAAHPRARGWVRAYLPGYSTDGSRAIVRAGVGPSAHGAMLTALLEKRGDKWLVKWHHIARYA